MSAADRLRAQLFGREKGGAPRYEARTKLAAGVGELAALIQHMAPHNPLSMAIAASAGLVVRKLDGEPGQEAEMETQHQQLLQALRTVIDGALDPTMSTTAFRDLMAREGSRLKEEIAK